MNKLPKTFKFKLTKNMVKNVKFILWIISKGVKLPSNLTIDQYIKTYVLSSSYPAFVVEDCLLKVLIIGVYEQKIFENCDCDEIEIKEIELIENLSDELINLINAQQVISDACFVFSRLDVSKCDTNNIIEIKLLTNKLKKLMIDSYKNINLIL